jgi:hypothetical protein
MDIGTPNCDALYQVVKAEAGPKTSDSKIECLVALRRLLPAMTNLS